MIGRTLGIFECTALLGKAEWEKYIKLKTKSSGIRNGPYKKVVSRGAGLFQKIIVLDRFNTWRQDCEVFVESDSGLECSLVH